MASFADVEVYSVTTSQGILFIAEKPVLAFDVSGVLRVEWRG